MFLTGVQRPLFLRTLPKAEFIYFFFHSAAAFFMRLVVPGCAAA